MMNINSVVSLISFIFIFTLILVIMLYKKKQNKSIFQEFDERQLMARSNAYSTAFIVFMVLILIDAMLKLAEIHWCEDPLGELAALFITLLVFAWKAIPSDAFWGRNDAKYKKNMLIFYLAIGISQCAIALTGLNEMFADGLVTMRALSLFSGITFICIAAMIVLHDRRAKEEEEE